MGKSWQPLTCGFPYLNKFQLNLTSFHPPVVMANTGLKSILGQITAAGNAAAAWFRDQTAKKLAALGGDAFVINEIISCQEELQGLSHQGTPFFKCTACSDSNSDLATSC